MEGLPSRAGASVISGSASSTALRLHVLRGDGGEGVWVWGGSLAHLPAVRGVCVSGRAPLPALLLLEPAHLAACNASYRSQGLGPGACVRDVWVRAPPLARPQRVSWQSRHCQRTTGLSHHSGCLHTESPRGSPNIDSASSLPLPVLPEQQPGSGGEDGSGNGSPPPPLPGTSGRKDPDGSGALWVMVAPKSQGRLAWLV